jgi:hypothetical protein
MSQSSCPYCTRPVSIPAVFKAVLPSAICCPSCGRRVRVRNIRLLFAAYIVALAAVFALFLYARHQQLMTRGQRLIVVVASIFAVDFTASAFIARTGRFEKYDNEG